MVTIKRWLGGVAVVAILCGLSQSAEAARQPVRRLAAIPLQGACRIINGVRVCPQQQQYRPRYQSAPMRLYFRGGW